MSLQQVIDAYVERQRSMERGIVLPEILQGARPAALGGSAGGGAGDGPRSVKLSNSYAEQFESLCMRSRVMETRQGSRSAPEACR